jgi:hypothetical protein
MVAIATTGCIVCAWPVTVVNQIVLALLLSERSTITVRGVNRLGQLGRVSRNLTT